MSCAAGLPACLFPLPASLQVLLEEEEASGAFRPVQRAPDHAVWGEVARLLSRKRDAIQPLHALGLLPGEVGAALCHAVLGCALQRCRCGASVI